jgi:DNA-binding MarR family transcriptional regulator
MENDDIKQAFTKVKEDMIFLAEEVITLKNQINEIKFIVSGLVSSVNLLRKENIEFSKQFLNPSNNLDYPTINSKPTDIQTVPQEIKGLKNPNINFSMGNRGVPTDSQTHHQIGPQTEKSTLFSIPSLQPMNNLSSVERNIKEVSLIIDSLDMLKKEIRLKFKQLTSQEMTVFSTIYQKEELNPSKVTYKEISKTLGLSESSIRDYVQKMLNKGIPIKKHKINNKLVLLSIPEDLKKIASLNTIIQLRDL